MVSSRARSAAQNPISFEVRYFETIGSTNTYLASEASRGAPEGLVAVAQHQVAGRGRLGRSWTEPAGSSLLMSVLLRPRLGDDQLFWCSAALSMSACDASRAVAGVEAVLKWPNDLLVGTGKLAGVLAERVAPPGSGQMGPGVVTGIGLNVNWLDGLPPTATSLSLHCGHEVDRTALLEALLESLAVRYESLHDPKGLDSQMADYRAMCATLDTKVLVTMVGEQFSGTAVDVTSQGQLLVETSYGSRVVSAGDVVHLRPAEKGPAEKGQAGKGPAEKRPAEKGPAEKGQAGKGP